MKTVGTGGADDSPSFTILNSMVKAEAGQRPALPGHVPVLRAVILAAGLVLTVGVWESAPAWGQCEVATLVAADAEKFDSAGKSVSISGDPLRGGGLVAVVGANKDDAGFESGAAYIYRFNGNAWVQEDRLTASDAAQQDFFGRSVSISGDAVLVGAYRNDDAGESSGSAYVFRFDGIQWNEEAKLTASDAGRGDRYGLSVALSGDVAVIAAAFDDDGGFSSGSAYVYRFNGAAWVEEAKLTAAGASPNDLFGSSVAVAGDVIVIGTHLDDEKGNDAGAAYVYRFDGNNWNEEAMLTASDAAPFDQFGFSVGVDGDRVVVGAHLDDDSGSGSGSAYVYRFDGADWVEEGKLTASDAAGLDQFGNAVSISGDTAVVGAHADDDAGPKSGGAYVYRFDGNNWIEQAKLSASDAGEDDRFGRSVSVSGDTAVVGAWLHSGDPGPWSGSAYVFNLVGITGDLDEDCDVDLTDFANFELCFGGPDTPPAETCPLGVDADLDDDGDADFTDFAIFQVFFTGP